MQLYSLLETRALGDILDLWGGGKHGLICPCPDPSVVGDLRASCGASCWTGVHSSLLSLRSTR